MLNLMKNRFLRIPDKLHIIIIAVIIMPLFIGTAIYFSGHFTNTYKVAFISDYEITLPKSSSIQIDIMNKQPAISALVMGKYDAFVEVNQDGLYNVITVKGESDRKVIQSFFENGKIPESNPTEQRGIGTNILGFVLMLALMQGVALTTFYPEDRMNSILKRILISPVNSKQYIIAQGIFTFICLFIPTFIVISITKICFGIDIGFELGTLATVLAILTAFATAFSLFMASALDRNISLATSGISIITCILAGCFFNFTGNNRVLDMLCYFLPQKSFMSLAQGVENGGYFHEFAGQITYIVTWIVALWLLGNILTNRKLKNGAY